MSAKKVLVTGSTGFLGGYVLKELVDKGYEVRATDLPRADFSTAESLGVEKTTSDLLDYDSLLRTVKGVDAVIHLGGIFDIGGDRKLLFDVNVKGTETICRAALNRGVERLV
jgi:nucleoside-diphosphate-sugar epimerase